MILATLAVLSVVGKAFCCLMPSICCLNLSQILDQSQSTCQQIKNHLKQKLSMMWPWLKKNDKGEICQWSSTSDNGDLLRMLVKNEKFKPSTTDVQLILIQLFEFWSYRCQQEFLKRSYVLCLSNMYLKQ